MFMKRGELEPIAPQEVMNNMYEGASLDEYLAAYAHGEVEEIDAEFALSQYTVGLAELSYCNGNIDVDTVRLGFGRLTEGYNKAANEAFGGQPAPTMSRTILETLHIVKPKPQKYYSGIETNERYWAIQFMEQFGNESIVQRREDEPENEYYARYLQACIQGFSWGIFHLHLRT